VDFKVEGDDVLKQISTVLIGSFGQQPESRVGRASKVRKLQPPSVEASILVVSADTINSQHVRLDCLTYFNNTVSME
jgi:hypothetical protein